jgi:Mn-dependent DtxR family transcriptional regulator
MRIRDVAAEVGITERGVQRIIAELEAAGYLERARRGRRNAYHIHGTRPMRHRIERHRKIEDLIRLVHGGS